MGCLGGIVQSASNPTSCGKEGGDSGWMRTWAVQEQSFAEWTADDDSRMTSSSIAEIASEVYFCESEKAYQEAWVRMALGEPE